MQVKRLKGEGFRNLLAFDFEPSEGINLIVGENAQGKTNLVEALWLFTGTKSFRGSKDKELITLGKGKAHLKLDFLTEGILREAEIVIENKRVCFLDTKRLKGPAEMVGKFCAVVFSPSDLRLIKEGPSERRRFLDLAIAQLYPSYVNISKQYAKAVAQRNSIIKNYEYMDGGEELLSAFEAEICSLGQQIEKYRINYCSLLKNSIHKIYDGISSMREELEIEYLATGGEDLAEKLYKSRSHDKFSGVTSVGPHRDDIEFLLNGISARNFGSQGQQRSIALALKLTEADILTKKTGERPIAILDDVMSELDLSRQNYILNHIKDWQVFITCCDPNIPALLNVGKVFTATNGKIKAN